MKNKARSLLQFLSIIALVIPLAAFSGQPAAAATIGQWSAIDDVATQMGQGVFGMAVYGDRVFAVGNLSDAGGNLEADYMAQVESGVWGKIPGPNPSDYTVGKRIWVSIVHRGVLYIGGEFLSISSTANAVRVAQYDISTNTFSEMNGGIDNGSVEALFASGDTIYVGGSFTNAGGVADADRIATYNTSTNTWGAVGKGLNGAVYDIWVDGGNVYAAGAFTDDQDTGSALRIAVYDGVSWSSVGGGLHNSVRQVEVTSDGTIYAAGEFTNAGGVGEADYVAKYSNGAWSALSTDTLNNIVQGMAIRNGVVYVGGNFTGVNDGIDGEDYVAKFEDGELSALNGDGSGLSNIVVHLLIDGDTLYAGGSFDDAGGDPNADKIAQFGLPPIPDTVVDSATTISKEIAGSGITTLLSGRAYVSVPANAIPDGESNCKVVITKKGDSGDYGFSLDDQVWDVSIVCDSGKVSILYAPITVCIRPQDGLTTDKQLFHKHGGGSFTALASTGEKSGYVCGQTQTLSLFTLGSVAVPNTGFAPGVVTVLPEQPASAAYTASDLTLSIPELGLDMDIVGVPQGPNGWDVSWLGDDAGYLYGTAFPTMAGNTVLTAHVWNADNTPGPFAELDQLQYGDRFTISAWGSTYTYEVRSSSLYSPASLQPLRHEDYDWVTLITCHDFNEATGSYSLRRVVRAVLVSVE